MNLGTAVKNLDISPQFSQYSKVRIYVGTDDDGTDVFYEAGNDTGRTLELKNPFGTQAMANNILTTLGAWQYQPYTAKGAITNPALELGDPVTINGVDSAIYIRATHFGALHDLDISAPYDEEVDHEYAFETSEQREYKRQYAETKAYLKITATQISAEVTRATSEEQRLNAALNVQAGQISAEVTRATSAEQSLNAALNVQAGQISAKVSKTGGDSSSFGWALNESSFVLQSDGQAVFVCDDSGIKVNGEIIATSGYIGTESQGFKITASAIMNGMTSFSDTTHNGIYIGTDGISLGGGKFKVDSQGNMTATSGTFSGSVHAGSIISDDVNDRLSGSYISPGSIGTGSGSALSDGAIGGINWGSNFGLMCDQQYTADWVVGNHFMCYSPGHYTGNLYGDVVRDADSYNTVDTYYLKVAGLSASWETKDFLTSAYPSLSYGKPQSIWVQGTNGTTYTINRVVGVNSGTSSDGISYLG